MNWNERTSKDEKPRPQISFLRRLGLAWLLRDWKAYNLILAERNQERSPKKAGAK